MEIGLYDLSTDINEQADVAADYPAVVQEMKAIMKAAHTPATIERFKIKELGDKIVKSDE